MPSRKFKIDPEGPERLELRWSGLFHNTEVRLDDQPVGAFADKAALKRGGAFRLPDGSELRVQLEEKFGGGGLMLHRNGAPVAGSDADPNTQVKSATAIVYFVGGFNVVLGVAAAAGVEFLQRFGLGLATVALGAVYLVLAFFTGRRSRVALGLAMALYAIDGVLGLVASVGAGQTPGVGGIVMRVLFLMAMGRAFGVMGSPAATAPTGTR